MNEFFLPDDSDGAFQVLHMPDFGLSWAGANPFGEGFCLGSEMGDLVLTDTQGRPRSGLGRASVSREAINGVALSQGWLAVTTRRDVNFISPQLLDRSSTEAVILSCGVPEVVVAPRGHFVFPMGHAGIMFVKPGMKVGEPVTISNAEHLGLNFCRLVALEAENGKDLIVAAGRRGGLGFADFEAGSRGHILSTVKFDGLDIVDVCSIGVPGHLQAVAAAARDGSLIFFRDIRTDKNPLTFKYKSISGVVYRVLSAQGDIYLLTSRGLFVLFRLAERFLQGTLGQITTNIMALPIEAADANLVDQRWLLVVGVQDLFKFDTRKLPKSPEEASSEDQVDGKAPWPASSVPEKLDLQPQWEDASFDEQNSENLTAACSA